MASRSRTYARALALWARRYPLAPRYRPDERIALTTIDGVRLAGARLAGPDDAPCTVVLVHGFLNSSRSPMIYAFARYLSQSVHVVVPDLRGHGASEGRTTIGTLEPLDVAAAVNSARSDLPVVTVGTSLGGAAALRHAALFGGVAGVVAISAPAWWSASERPGTVRMQRLVASRAGREVAGRLMRTRIGTCDPGVVIVELVGSIAPAFTVVAHDPDDIYFGEEHARAIHEQAGEPRSLWLMPGAGHGSDLLTPVLADRVLKELRSQLSR